MFNIDYFHEYTRGSGVKVAVLDSELYSGHKEFKGRDIHYKEFIDSNNPNYHGTAISSLIVGDSLGFAPDVELYHIKMLSDKFGSGRSWDRAFSYAMKQDVDIICMSIGTKGELSPSIRQSIQWAKERNIIMTAPSGNEGKHLLRNPANNDNVIAVGGVSHDKTLSKKSNNSPHIELRGLSEDVLIANIDGENSYSSKSGTSFANAMVASQIALIIAYSMSNGKNIDVRDFINKYTSKFREDFKVLDMKKVKKELDIYLGL